MTAATSTRPSHAAIPLRRLRLRQRHRRPYRPGPPAHRRSPDCVRRRSAPHLPGTAHRRPGSGDLALRVTDHRIRHHTHDAHTAARPTITAKLAGWTTSTRSSRSASPRRTAFRSQSTHGSNARAHSSIRSANTGEDSSNSRPHPGHCEPCPGNTSTVRPDAPAAPVTRPGADAPGPARPARPSPPPATRPRPRPARRAGLAKATGRSRGERGVLQWTWRTRSGVRPGPPGLPSEAADTTRGTTPSTGVTGSAAGSSGASSRIRWALVPLTPKEETPARRGRPVWGQSRSSVSSSIAPGRPVDLGRGGVDVEGGGEDAVPHRLDHLDHTGDTRGGLRVPDVRLQRAQPQRPFAVLAVGGEQRLRLDRVTEDGTRAVALDRVHVRRGQARLGQRLADHALLRGAVRGSQAVRGAVLIDGGRADDGLPGAPCAAPRLLLQDDHARALGPARAVGRVGVRLAAAVGGQRPLPRELHEHPGAGHDGGTAGRAIEHSRGAAPGRPGAWRPGTRSRRCRRSPQGLRARRRTRCGPRPAPGGAGAGEALQLRWDRAAGGIALVDDAHEDADVGALERRARRCRPAPAPPRTFRGRSRCCGPSPPPHAARSRTGRRRRGPPRAGSRPGRRRTCPSCRGRRRTVPPGPSPGRSGTARCRRRVRGRVATGRRGRSPRRAVSRHAHDGDRLRLGLKFTDALLGAARVGGTRLR